MPGPVRANGTSFSAVPLVAGVADRVRADEARVLLAAPAEAGLDRVAVLGQVVAVEVEADLEAERVAGAEADRAWRPAAVSASHTAVACSGGEQQLDAVLARVAGAGDEDVRRAGDASACVVRNRFGSSPSARLCDQVARLRPLDREHRVVVRAGPRPVTSKSARVLLEPREVLLVVARVRDGEEAVGPEAVGEEVVEHAAVVLARARSTARRPRRSCVTSLERMRWRNASASGPLRLDLAHVADVEHADLRRAPPHAPRGSPRTAPASPTRRTAPAAPRRRHGDRAAACA